MRLTSLFVLFGIALLALFSSASTQPAEAGESVMLVADQWCPYNCDPESEAPGFMIEIAKQAFSRHGIAVSYQLLPWSRAIEETRRGRFTAIVGASHSDAPDFIFPNTAQGRMESCFYVKKDSPWKYQGIDSLRQVSLGVIADYAYGDRLDDYIRQHQDEPRQIQVISGDDGLELNVRKLMAGRIDVLVEDRAVMAYHLSQHPEVKENVVLAGVFPDSEQAALYVAFSPSHPDSRRYAQILSDETRAMQRSGELTKILNKYAPK